MSEQIAVVAGAGGGGCFRAGTQVQLEGGTTIAIELLKEGDTVLAFDENGAIHTAKVVRLHYHAQPQPILKVKFWRGEVFITPNHWVLNQYGNFVEMGSLTDHDALVDGMGHLRPIIGAELVGHEPVWNLTVDPHHTFIANGIRVHNGGHRERYPVVAGAGGGGGGKGGGGSARAAVEDPDSLQSRGMVSILDLLGEGQIGGLVNGAKSIFFNDTPLMNADGNYNFAGVSWDQRTGTQNQPIMGAFSSIEAPTVVNTKVTRAIPINATISNPNADAVRLIVSVSGLTSQDTTTGDVHGTSVYFRFDISTNGGAFIPFSGDLCISGKTRSKYQRSYHYALPRTDTGGAKAEYWTIRMTRLSDDPPASVQNALIFDTLIEVVDTKLNYPNSALVGVTIDSSQFNSIPNRAYLVDGLYIRVPSNYNPTSRTYAGIWDGTFKVAISNNPAWVLYDVLTNARYGLGQFLNAQQIDKAKLYQIGKYCDELVPSGSFDSFGNPIYEPRFTINTAIQQQAEAYKLISDLTSVFRGMAYWNGGQVGFMQDSPGDVQMIYSQANVVDGVFTYMGSSRKDRHSVAHIGWNDPVQNYKRVVEYVENPAMIAKVGIRKLETLAFGCTSRGQAHRVGLWMLYTEQFESDVVSFRVGIDSAFVLPGDIIKIHDTSRAGNRMGGRLVAATTTSATLDAPTKLRGKEGTVISIRMPDGTFVERIVRYMSSNVEVEVTEVRWYEPLPELPAANAIWMIAEPDLKPMMARVIGIAQGETPGEFAISAVEHNPSKFAAIEQGLRLEEQPTSLVSTKYQAPVKEVIFSESSVTIAPGVQGLNLNVSWEGNGAYYEVTWKRYGKYETNWETITTTNPMIELGNVRAGTYKFVIVAVNSFGVKSSKVESNYTTIGKTAAPGDVVNFQVTKRSRDLLLTWDAVTDINLKGYEVRVGPSWDAGVVITTNFYGTMLTHDQDTAGSYFYHIRSINMEDAYSDNVSTFKLVLTAPAAVKRFDVIQSGTRLELNWAANEEPDIAYYEVREGMAWESSKVIAEAKATSLTVPSGSIGYRMFWIKAVAAPGIYSERASWIDTNIAMPTNSNIVASLNEAVMAWPGNKVNMRHVGNDIMMNDGVSRCEYITHLDLLDNFRAQNSIYGTVGSVIYGTDTITWDASAWDWDDAEANRHWAPDGQVDSVKTKYQISRKVGLRLNDLEGWSLNNSLTSVTGKTATTATNVEYLDGRHSKGLHLRGGTVVDWQSINIPAIFRKTFWIIPKMIGNSAQISILEMATADGKKLRLAYDEPTQTFTLSDHLERHVSASLTIEPSDVIGVGIVQTETTRKLYVGKVGGLVATGEANIAPLGVFTTLRMYWS